MRYRKKPVVIEARRFEANNEVGSPHMDALVEWMNSCSPQEFSRLLGKIAWHDRTAIYIRTFEGIMTASCGDWIIRGVKGEFYPCTPDVFDASYEEIDA